MMNGQQAVEFIKKKVEKKKRIKYFFKQKYNVTLVFVIYFIQSENLKNKKAISDLN